MTTDQFKTARRNAMAKYMSEAYAASKDKNATRHQKAAATRRFNQCADIVSEWDLAGFWTIANTTSYSTLYRKQDDTNAVSPF